ncbi:hypothetical protein [Brevibacillus sp. HD3.3A]|uniref:hypothetical protein n=1 Tax=Brevibacillus sp. HD3.3A TaxID=2738979 RepID=UPI00156B34AF|nr:hypothetical protein [Brevibacillus sp. HD3.3A]UED70713.1 hypothetical protein HP435_08780 [Brevibacillus sp. HD3.3A]
MKQETSPFWEEYKKTAKLVSWENEKAMQVSGGKVTVRSVFARLVNLEKEISWLQKVIESDRDIPSSIADMLQNSLEERLQLKARLEKVLDETTVELPD